MNRFGTVFTAALFALGATEALAQDAKTGGVKIDGKATQIGVIKNNANVALGQGATARTRVSNVNGNVDIGGDMTQIGVIKNNANVALGQDSEACTEVATIGSADGCD